MRDTQTACGSPNEVQRALLGHPIVTAGAQEWARTLAGGARLIELRSDEPVLAAGDHPPHVFLLLSGVVCLQRLDSQGRQQTVCHVAAPASLGAAEAVSGMALQHGISALTGCRLVRVERAAFLRFLDHEPAAQRWLIAELCARNCAGENEAETSVLAVRLAALLLTFSDLFGKRCGDEIIIHKPITQEYLAASLGVAARSIRRVLKDWRQVGWISEHKRWMVLREPLQLSDLCSGARFKLVRPFSEQRGQSAA